MQSKTLTITIINNSTPMNIIGRVASIVIAFILPIALGVFLESTAMQWVGFAFGLVFFVGAVNNFHKSNTFKSVNEAKAYLDRIEAE